MLLSQFADDTNLFLQASARNIDAVTQTLECAHRNLGLTINYEKTTIYRIGSLKDTNAKYYTIKDFQWDDPPIYTLGIHVTTDPVKMAKINLTPLVTKTETALNFWKNRDLSLTGRVLVVNTLIESIFVYRFSVLPVIDEDIINRVQALIWAFIWKDKKAKIAYEKLTVPKDQGGLRLVDLKKKHISLLAQWPFIISVNSFLGKCMYQAINIPIGEDFWLCNIKYQDAQNIIEDSFWKYVVIAWAKVNFVTPTSISAVKKQFLWYNSWIKKDKKPFLLKNLYDAGIKYIEDLLDNNDQWIPH